MQLTTEQIKRLQDEKPAISGTKEEGTDGMGVERGTQWLAVLTGDGELQVRSSCGKEYEG